MPFNRLLTLLVCCFLCATLASAQDNDIDPNATSELGTGVKRAYIGQYHFVDETGDSVLMVVIRDLNCFPKLVFKNKKEAKNFVFFNYLEERDWGKRVLAKLTHDIAQKVSD